MPPENMCRPLLSKIKMGVDWMANHTFVFTMSPPKGNLFFRLVNTNGP
jgi:hypothetical protein